jgi:integrase
MKHLIDSYIESKKNAWSPTTIKSERSRLIGLVRSGESATELLNRLKAEGQKLHSIKKGFMRMSQFQAEMFPTEPNVYASFLKQNRRLFLNSYQRVAVATTFAEAKERIGTIKDEKLRLHCLAILHSGLRIAEANAVKDGYVVGKGNKRRRVYNTDGLDTSIHRDRVARALKRLGLKPHDLRKLFATELAQKGMDAPTLCAIMGWSNIETAYLYLQPLQESAIAAALGGML